MDCYYSNLLMLRKSLISCFIGDNDMVKIPVDHWKIINKVIKYLRCTFKYELHYSRYLVVLKGYNDVNWISDTKDSKYINRYIFIFEKAVVSWKSSKQICIARCMMK